MCARPVFETGKGRLCPECGQPIAACRCRLGIDDLIPPRVSCVLRVERRTSGKTVTVVAGLPRNREFLAALAGELKRACGTGGTATADAVELQGDQREKLRPLLRARGFRVQG